MKQVRCAIYTRKSTDEGLEQEFNSLHAQREACEAYITSQKHEGWELLPEYYDDGGFSGGNMERPALKQLMKAVEAGNVDVIVVYKVDRLTRSLTDFAKLVEIMDDKNVSFVSITQQFNTTTSMGRLTLNVLLSFAQFEREVTGERIRDKIALSKKKGKWMGGTVPLGYDLEDKKLLVNETEAKQVRHIYERYLELQSVNKLKLELDRDGYCTKVRTAKNGNQSGGKPFWKGNLYRILQNRHYLGETPHRDKSYPGEHDGIIDQEMFDKVQQTIARVKMRRFSGEGKTSPSLLAGKLFDDRGNYMTPKHSRTHRRHYRYYTSQAIIRSAPDEAGSLPNIPAYEIEELTQSELRKFLKDDKQLQSHLNGESITEQKRLLETAKEIDEKWSERDSEENLIFISGVVAKVILSDKDVVISLDARNMVELLKGKFVSSAPLEPEVLITITRQVKLSATKDGSKVIVGGIASSCNKQLVKAIARAHLWNQQLLKGEVTSIVEIKKQENINSSSYIRKTMQLQFLAPDITEAILAGNHPRHLTFDRLSKISRISDWQEQRQALNF